LREEVHKLRELDSSHGKLNGKQFKADLKDVNHFMEKNHLLPHLQIVTDGKHAGEIRHGAHKQDVAHRHDATHKHDSAHKHESAHKLDSTHKHEPAHKEDAKHKHDHGPTLNAAAGGKTEHKVGTGQRANSARGEVPGGADLAGARQTRTVYAPGDPSSRGEQSETDEYSKSASQPASDEAGAAPGTNLSQNRQLFEPNGSGESLQASQTDATAQKETYFDTAQQAGMTPGENQQLAPSENRFDDQSQTPTPNRESKLTTLTSAVERAKAGGRPVNIAQIGDSHVAAGIETASLAKKFAENEGLNQNQVNYSYKGVVGKTASYAASHPNEFLGKINPSTDLVVVSFGSNEAQKHVGDGYKNDYSRLIGEIRQKAPNASILMVGPTDGAFWNSNRRLPGLGSVVEAQKAVQAQTANSAYLDVLPVTGSMNSMRSRGMLSRDNLHLTAAGYKIVGGSIADSVIANA
jgi:lysophospholipase L1-like esterase